MKRIIFALAMIVAMASCAQTSPKEKVADSGVADSGVADPAEQLRRDIGEMLLVGFRGTTIDDKSHIARDIQQYHVGSVILFEYDAPTGTRHRNIESPAQLQKLCSQLQGLAGGTLLIGIDQEGGNVARMRPKDGFPPVMSAQASAEEGTDAVRKMAEKTGEMLEVAGINLNFAPCVDVNLNPECPVIGKMGRSFSADAQYVAECAEIWMEAQRAHGVISCLKHFPGHGSATGDTHAGLVDVTDTWQPAELEPYRTLIAKGGVDMVMVAHVVNHQLGDKLPASLSATVVTKLLRGELGYDGVVVTDDLAMGAITRQYGYEEAVRMAILAGCDLLCLSNNGGGTYNADLVPQTVAIIQNLVSQGTVSAEAIHRSAERVRALKKKQ